MLFSERHKVKDHKKMLICMTERNKSNPIMLHVLFFHHIFHPVLVKGNGRCSTFKDIWGIGIVGTFPDEFKRLFVVSIFSHFCTKIFLFLPEFSLLLRFRSYVKMLIKFQRKIMTCIQDYRKKWNVCII